MRRRSSRLRSTLQVACLVTCFLGVAQASAQPYIRIVPWTNPTYSYTLQSDVVYGQGEVNGGGTFEDMEMDIYIPDIPPPVNGSNTMPLMLMVHGGGFIYGSKTNANVVASAQEYANRGWMVAAINYRLQSDDPIPSTRMQNLLDHFGGLGGATLRQRTLVSVIDDILTALDFMHARTDVYNPWTTVWGSSAGGNASLAASFALDDHGISRPPVALVVELAGRFEGTAVGNPFDSPVTGDPILMSVTGTADPLHIYSLETADWALNVGLPHDFQVIDGAGHPPDMFANVASSGVMLYQHSIDLHHQTVWSGLNQGPQPPGC